MSRDNYDYNRGSYVCGYPSEQQLRDDKLIEELKVYLRQSKLSVTGNKRTLKQRLHDHMQSGKIY